MLGYWPEYSKDTKHNKSTLENERPGMYRALLEKLDRLYGPIP